MADEPTVPPESSTEESTVEENIEDVEDRIFDYVGALEQRVAALESELANLTGQHANYDERWSGIDARFEQLNGGGTPPAPVDHGPEPTHWYFRKVGGKQF